MNKNVLVITGTRADYGILRPVLRAIQKAKTLSLQLVVTGMHLDRAFGNTLRYIKDDRFPIHAKLHTLSGDDSPRGMAIFVGRTLEACIKTFRRLRPDIVLVLGDRGEMLAAATAAMYMGIPIAHLHGGETSGTVDDRTRRAITAMADVHLTTTQEHADTVARLRGAEKDIYVVGAPALDTIRSLKKISKKNLCARVGFRADHPVILFVQHPDTDEVLPPQEQLAPTLSALRSLTNAQVIVLGANADAGGRRCNRLLQAFTEELPHRRFIPSMPHEEYISWLAAADVLVGNSSSGIIEAASLGTPVINIGKRQQGRLRSGNVIDVGYRALDIAQTLRSILSSRRRIRVRNVYGNGTSAQRIVRILEQWFKQREQSV